MCSHFIYRHHTCPVIKLYVPQEGTVSWVPLALLRRVSAYLHEKRLELDCHVSSNGREKNIPDDRQKPSEKVSPHVSYGLKSPMRASPEHSELRLWAVGATHNGQGGLVEWLPGTEWSVLAEEKSPCQLARKN